MTELHERTGFGGSAVYVLRRGPFRAAGLPGRPDEMVRFAPESLRWTALGTGYGDWLSWTVSGGAEGASAAPRRAERWGGSVA
ncbi:DUF2625 family protein [Streptomyces sp. NPDC059352]|uniref:DUF2625 family protein n=1 Tax=Streptomyces sp. NPDC059352 TaxID=3346810 RepID=UPI0036A1885C